MLIGGNSSINGTWTAPRANGGLIDDLLSFDPVVLQAKWNITSPFTFIVEPMLFIAQAGHTTLMNRVEDAKSHIVISPFLSNQEDVECDGLPVNVSLTPDCLDPLYGRNRKQGARRYNTQFSVLFDSTANALSALDVYHTQGVQSVVILYVSDGTFATLAAANAATGASQYNIAVLDTIELVPGGCQTITTCPAANCSQPTNCPPLTALNFDQTFVFPNGQTGLEVAAHLKALNPDALIMIFGSSVGMWSITRMIAGMKTLNWMPKAMSFGGNDAAVNPYLDDPSQKTHTLGTRPWAKELRGPIVRTLGGGGNGQ